MNEVEWDGGEDDTPAPGCPHNCEHFYVACEGDLRELLMQVKLGSDPDIALMEFYANAEGSDDEDDD